LGIFKPFLGSMLIPFSSTRWISFPRYSESLMESRCLALIKGGGLAGREPSERYTPLAENGKQAHPDLSREDRSISKECANSSRGEILLVDASQTLNLSLPILED
jgi:hypothetical protein